MNFRYDINALRALAIIGVVLFHYKVPHLDGGFTGVDVFFVISGYLMSKIVLNGLDKGNFSLLDFYAKRVKRIVPALLGMVAVVTVACFFLYFPHDYAINEKNASASVLFLSNMWYWKHSSYFDASSETNLFLHTWSLSVEWQFYMVYPIVLSLLARVVRSKRWLLAIFAFSSAVIFMLANHVTAKDPTASFYLLPTRSWEMLAGGVAFLVDGRVRSRVAGGVIACLGYSVILYCFVFFNDKMPWPGLHTLVPVLATMAVIVANFDLALLKNKLLQFVGGISYSVYLWHWPIYVIALYYGVKVDPLWIIGLILLSTLLGWLSYEYIESIKIIAVKRVVVAMSALCFITAFLAVSKVNHVVFNKVAIEMSEFKEHYTEEIDLQFSHGKCFVNIKLDGDRLVDTANCLKLDDKRKNFLLIGDSHAAQYARSLHEWFNTRNYNFLQSTASGCLPFIEQNGSEVSYKHTRYIFKHFLTKNKGKINGVILGGNWYHYLNGPNETMMADLRKTITYLDSLGIRSLILGQNEVYSIPYPTILAQEKQFNISLNKKYRVAAAQEANKLLMTNFSDRYLNVFNELEVPGLSNKHYPYMFDENHLTKFGADLIANGTPGSGQLNKLLN